MHKANIMVLKWEATNTGHTAKINGIPVAQASEAFFGTYYTVVMLLPYDGSERKFATLEDAQAFICTDVLRTVNLLLQ